MPFSWGCAEGGEREETWGAGSAKALTLDGPSQCRHRVPWILLRHNIRAQSLPTVVCRWMCRRAHMCVQKCVRARVCVPIALPPGLIEYTPSACQW